MSRRAAVSLIVRPGLGDGSSPAPVPDRRGEVDMSLILIHEPRRGRTDWHARLQEEGHEVTVTHGRQALLEALAARRSDTIVYVMSDLALDLGVLWLVRRIAPRLPIILLGGPAGLEARRSVQELRPTYYGMFPLEPSELCDAVRAALGQESGRRVAS